MADDDIDSLLQLFVIEEWPLDTYLCQVAAVVRECARRRRGQSWPFLRTIGRGDSGTTLLVIVDPADEFNALSNSAGSLVELRHEPTPGRSDRVVVYDVSNRQSGRLRFNDARTIAPLLTAGLLNGSATVTAVRMRADGSVALRISIDLAELNPR